MIVQSVWTKPQDVKPQKVFQVYLEGEGLEASEDRVILLPDHLGCGSDTESHYGGALCHQIRQTPNSSVHQNSTVQSRKMLYCGDGRFSLRVDFAGRYRVCVCDASAIAMQKGITPEDRYPGDSKFLCGGTSTYAVAPKNGGVLHIGVGVSTIDEGIDGGDSVSSGDPQVVERPVETT
jgi:hypothetical protein